MPSALRPLIILVLAAVIASPQAAPVSVDIFGEVTSGTFAGAIGSGTLSFDSDLVSGIGAETLTPQTGLTVSLTFLGQVFTDVDDIDYPGFPELDFMDGVMVEFDYVVSEVNGTTLTAIDTPGVFGFNMLAVTQSEAPGGGLMISGDLTVDETGAVPIPAALPLCGAGLALLGALGRKRRNA
ncbi:MAG: hypothetical protein RLW62_15240 [Gammaproteobacteria bacterium]